MFSKVKTLALHLVVYGTGDVAVSAVGFFLLPLFTRVLTQRDYGILNLLAVIELIAKVAFRWGVDAAFMRLYYDCEDKRSRQKLASTIFLFLLAANGTVLALTFAAAPLLASWPAVASRFPAAATQHGGTLAMLAGIVLVNTFIGGFFFIPFQVLRIEGKPLEFSALSFSRAAATMGLRILLVAGAHLGVLGWWLADIIITLAFTGVLVGRFARLIRPVFSTKVLREALRFGLPRLPHGIAQQVVGPGTDGMLLLLFLPAAPNVLDRIGVYGMGATFGLILKYFLSAFEVAWTPFYFERMKDPDAKATFSRVATYGIAVLVFLAAGLSAISFDLLRVMTRGFAGAAPVVPWIAIGVTLQGVYLLTSIGLSITKHTEYYPVATIVSAGVNVGCNMLLIPRFGILGPAYSNVISWATMAAMAFYFSRRLYPISYEWGRLARIVLAGIVAYGVAKWPLPAVMYSPLGVLVRGSIVVVVFPACLAATGFFRRGEISRLRSIVEALRTVRKRRAADRASSTAVGAAGTDVSELDS